MLSTLKNGDLKNQPEQHTPGRTSPAGFSKNKKKGQKVENMKKSLRKGIIVKYCGDDKELVKVWGEYFEIFRKEGDFLRVSSLAKPDFGIIAAIPCKKCKIVNA